MPSHLSEEGDCLQTALPDVCLHAEMVLVSEPGATNVAPEGLKEVSLSQDVPYLPATLLCIQSS